MPWWPRHKDVFCGIPCCWGLLPIVGRCCCQSVGIRGRKLSIPVLFFLVVQHDGAVGVRDQEQMG